MQYFTMPYHPIPCHLYLPSNAHLQTLPTPHCTMYVSSFNGTVQCDKCFHATNTISNGCETQTGIWTTMTFQRKTFTLCVQWIYVNCAAGGYTSGATLHWGGATFLVGAESGGPHAKLHCPAILIPAKSSGCSKVESGWSTQKRKVWIKAYGGENG